MSTMTVSTGPTHWVHICGCCLGCGVDPEMVFRAGKKPVVCSTCGHLCNCPGCAAEKD